MHKSSESPASNLDTSNNAGVSAVNVADAVSSITAIGGESDGPSKMLMSTSNSAPNADDSDSNDSDEADNVASVSSPNSVNRIHCRWHLTSPAYSANNADD